MNIEAILSRLLGVKRAGDGWSALCPAHPDRNPSLSVHEREGKTLVHCHAGCSVEAVLDALQLTSRDLFSESAGTQRIVATYDYCDEKNTLLFQVLRYEPKAFRQRRPDGDHGHL